MVVIAILPAPSIFAERLVHQLKDMRGIKVGNFLLYRNSLVCLVSGISSAENNSPVYITGIDSKREVHTAPSGEWSSIMGRTNELQKFGDDVFNNFLQEKQAKAKG